LILVTGASGFLGQHLVKALSANGKSMRALYFNHPPTNPLAQLPNVEWKKCDLLDIYNVEEALEGVTQVYHCAAIVSFQANDKERLLHDNVESTANLVNECLVQATNKLVHISSVGALGRPQEPGRFISENEDWEESHQKSAYGISKYLAETEVWRGIGEGLQAAILNPGIILGEGDWEKGSCQLFKNTYHEFPFYTLGVNAWIDVLDVVNMAQMLMESDIVAERFIASCGNFNYKYILTLIANAMGRRAPYIHANPFLAGLVWRYSSLKHKLNSKPALLTKETAQTASLQSFFTHEKWLNTFPDFQFRNINDTINRIAANYISSLPKKS